MAITVDKDNPAKAAAGIAMPKDRTVVVEVGIQDKYKVEEDVHSFISGDVNTSLLAHCY